MGEGVVCGVAVALVVIVIVQDGRGQLFLELGSEGDSDRQWHQNLLPERPRCIGEMARLQVHSAAAVL